MDADLASRISEIIHRAGSYCDDGRDFNPDQFRIQASDWGAAICGSQAVFDQALPGGPFADLGAARFLGEPILLNGGNPARAAALVMEYAQAVGPLLDILTDQVDDLAMMVFALAVDTLIDNIPLGAENPVRHSTLTSAPTTTSVASCTSTSKACTAECGEIGLIEHCRTHCQTTTFTATSCDSTSVGVSTTLSITTTTTSRFVWPTIPQPTFIQPPGAKCSSGVPLGVSMEKSLWTK